MLVGVAFSIDVHYENQPNKCKLALYKPVKRTLLTNLVTYTEYIYKCMCIHTYTSSIVIKTAVS